jgi:hypothetical protein
MAKSRKGGPDRHLTLKGLTWWAKLEIPKDCRSVLGGKTALPQSMETGDIRLARARRDEFERDTKAVFAAIRAGTYDPKGRVTSLAWGDGSFAIPFTKKTLVCPVRQPRAHYLVIVDTEQLHLFWHICAATQLFRNFKWISSTPQFLLETSIHSWPP